jgi:hypothetical protein
LERTSPLWLYWEVHCDPISDDYNVEDVNAEELWREWLQRHPRDEDAEAVYGPGAFRIWWYVEGPAIFEAAPFQDRRIAPEDAFDRDFLAFYTWPVHSQSGDRLQWTRLPVIDKVWRTHDLPQVHATKGGFVTEASGWKPAPLQPYLNVDQIARAAGLYSPRRWQA